MWRSRAMGGNGPAGFAFSWARAGSAFPSRAPSSKTPSKPSRTPEAGSRSRWPSPENAHQTSKERLAPYPTLRDARPYGLVPGGSGPVDPGEPVERVTQPDGANYVNVGVPIGERVTIGEWWDRQEECCSLVETTANWPHERIGYALPDLAGGEAPHPLLLWWALLLALSTFARYEPAAWTAAIDPSQSVLAVGLERVLDLAEDRVPARVLAVLRQGDRC
jgi:YaaC-like Protein